MPTLRTDVKKAGRLAARHLLDRGLRNFGFYSSSIRNHPADMYEGIRRELGKSARDCRIFDCGPSSPEDALAHEKQFKRLLAMPGIMAGTVSLGDWLNGLPKPAGIIATTESEAADIIWTCRRQGIRVPEDLAVIGYGNDDTQCILTIPPISSIMVPAREIGYRASALLERMIRGAKPPRKPILFPPLGVAARQSTDLIYAADPDLASASRYIREHLGEPIAVSDIVRHVAVSRRSLERRFVKTFGRTLGDEILRVKIESATSLLLGSDMKVPQIAAKVGLPAYSTFLRKFRHATGLSPAEFRVRHLRGLSTSLPSPAVSWLRAPKGLRVGDTQRGAAVTGESQNRCSLRNLRSCHRILEQRIQQATGSWQ
jgi:LacI family transcriptional regulator